MVFIRLTEIPRKETLINSVCYRELQPLLKVVGYKQEQVLGQKHGDESPHEQLNECVVAPVTHDIWQPRITGSLVTTNHRLHDWDHQTETRHLKHCSYENEEQRDTKPKLVSPFENLEKKPER